jgi:hypothetical protein
LEGYGVVVRGGHRYHLNPFLADPKGLHYGTAAGGTEGFPGFHTGETMEIAAPYAQRKGVEYGNNNDSPTRKRIYDYPVIVTMDMRGLRPMADHDAIVFAQEAIRTVAQQALEHADEHGIAHTLQIFASDEFDDNERFPDNAYDALLYLSTPCLRSPAGCMASMVENKSESAARRVMETIAKGGRDLDYWLAKAVGQFRYTQDISAERIIEIRYMRPYWDEVYFGSEGMSDAKAERIEKNGWGLMSADDGQIYLKTKTVWRNQEQLHFPWIKNRRTEYHGTSYRNVILAAPWLAEVLPVPPKPYEEAP